MPTNPNVRRELLEKLGITRQALSQRSKRIKGSYGPMTTEEAVYVIAHNEGLDLSKHLPISTLDRVRSLIPRDIPTATSQPPSRQKVSTPRQRKVKSYPLVTVALAKTGNNLGTEIYPRLFILETSIRNLITQGLSKQESDWWDKYVPSRIRNNVARTMKREKRYPYRESRGNHPLSYANFSDLKAIIIANKPNFEDVILDFEWFVVRMDEIYMVRNNLTHCVPLSKDDIIRINLFFRDWARMLETAGLK